jgi:MFS family permease
MGTIDKLSPAAGATSRPQGAALAPLREPLFRWLWGAAVISYTGTWMQNVGAGWLMTQLTLSPLMVGLVQAAMALPVFFVILPAGALADLMDRRRLLLFTQGWMVIASAVLGILTLTSCVSPWVLLLFTFLLGIGAVMNDPAWQAITPEIVTPENHAAAVALNSAGFNVARALGPPLGGLVIALAGSGTAFLLNALSFFGVILFLVRWERPHTPGVGRGRVFEAMKEGIAYVRGARLMRAVLVRAGVFSVAATALPALLPIVARPYGSRGFGLLVGFFGMGALAGAAVLPRLRNALAVDGAVAAAILLFAATTFAAGRVQGLPTLALVMFAAGTAWISILACLNVAAQMTAPAWVRARALSMYLLVLQGGMALGSAGWGAVAARVGVPDTLMWAALALVVGLAAIPGNRLSREELELAPALVRD